MYFTVLLLPLQGGVQSGFRLNGNQVGPYISVQTSVQNIFIMLTLFYEVALTGSPVYLKQGTWFNTGYLNIEWTFLFDVQTVSMQLPIVFISSQVQIYSLSYMQGDPHHARFHSYLSLFTLFMLLQVTGENLQTMFQGWEQVGLSSYLLINFWFTRIAANHAAMKAFLMNRVGDQGLSQGVIQSIIQFGDVSFASLFSQSSYINSELLWILLIFLILGAIAKSAQIGLHTWQPSAMEGPTPVSSQLHSSTMVVAGVYQLMRCSPLQELCDSSQIQITWLGSITAQLGASAGLFENDQKKIIAFSTTSQLGYMMVCIGLSQSNIAQFHLQNHSTFKALLFLAAGGVIHSQTSDQQDIRKMGAQVQQLPRTYSVFLQGSLSQMAFPFFTGFYSKDQIQEIAQVPTNFSNSIGYIFLMLAAILTATYSARLMIQTFLSTPHWHSRNDITNIHDPNPQMWYPQIILAIGSVLFGYWTQCLFSSQQGTAISSSGSLMVHPNHNYLLDGALSSSYLTLIPLQTLIIQQTQIPQTLNKSRNGSGNQSMYFSSLNHFDIGYVHQTHSVMKLSVISSGQFDKGLIEQIGPLGIVRVIHYLSYQIELMATGFLSHYVQYLQLTLFIMIMIYMFSIPQVQGCIFIGVMGVV